MRREELTASGMNHNHNLIFEKDFNEKKEKSSKYIKKQSTHIFNHKINYLLQPQYQPNT